MLKSRWLVGGSLLLSLWSVLVWTPVWAGEAVGFRTDGTGRYADARPPLTWGPEKNVVWATPLAHWNNGTPIIVGDRLITCAEPATLLACSLADGKVLWERSFRFEDLAATPEEAALIPGEHARVEALRREVGKMNNEIRTLRQQQKDKPDNQEIKDKIAAAQQKVGDLNRQLAPLMEAWHSLPVTHPITGYASATPVSDGQRIWMLFGTGVLACTDLEGNKQWVQVIEKPTNDWGHSTSSLLVGDLLIVHMRHLLALNKNTGEEVWKLAAPPSWGTPVVTKLGDTPVIITAAGDVVRATDGAHLAKNLCQPEYGNPLVNGREVYFIHHEGKAFRLPESATGEEFKPELLWETKVRKDRYYAGCVLHEGLIYAVTAAGIFSCVDAATGEVVYEQALNFGKGTCYPSIAYAGGVLFVSSDNGMTALVKPGRQFVELGRQTLEPFRSSPVFVGDKVYIRGLSKLYCLQDTSQP